MVAASWRLAERRRARAPAHAGPGGGDLRARAVHGQRATGHALEGLAPGDAWHGPVEGALGWHLVRLTAKQPGVIPPLAAIRSRVEDDWRAAMGRRQQDESYRALRDDYRIRIDR